MELKGIEKIIKEAISLGRKTLAEPEAKEILKLSSVLVPRFAVVKDVNGAIEAADNIGYPVALKVISPDITHKTDVGGVALGLKDAAEVEGRWAEMIYGIADEVPTAMIEGFLVEEMVPGGVEVIVGALRDEQFGPLLMFGAGGVSVELMRDVSFRLGPLTRDEAFSMMSEVKGFPLLTGFRGGHMKDLDAIADVLLKVSQLMEEAEGLKSIEINPLIVYDSGAVAVDARATVG